MFYQLYLLRYVVLIQQEQMSFMQTPRCVRLLPFRLNNEEVFCEMMAFFKSPCKLCLLLVLMTHVNSRCFSSPITLGYPADAQILQYLSFLGILGLSQRSISISSRWADNLRRVMFCLRCSDSKLMYGSVPHSGLRDFRNVNLLVFKRVVYEGPLKPFLSLNRRT